jgi:hypothetical protein
MNFFFRTDLKFGMGLTLILFVWTATSISVAQTDGFKPLFDASDLSDWEGDPKYWQLKKGVLIGEVTPTTLLKRNSFIVWKGDIPADFELKVQYRISDRGNSGINYRSEKIEGVRYALRGYQADLDGAQRYTGSNYEEKKRTTLAAQGEIVMIPKSRAGVDLQSQIERNQWTARRLMGKVPQVKTLKSKIGNGTWNEYHIVANGNRLRHFVNKTLMSEVVDNDPVFSRRDGLMGVQVHVGPPMKVEYKNFQIKELSPPEK